jgi:hypothetical protein
MMDPRELQVRNLLHRWKADIVCLQETKLAGVTPALIRSLWRGKFVDWICLGCYWGLWGYYFIMG